MDRLVIDVALRAVVWQLPPGRSHRLDWSEVIRLLRENSFLEGDETVTHIALDGDGLTWRLGYGRDA